MDFFLGGGTMLGKDEEKQCQFMFINLDDFVPKDTGTEFPLNASWSRKSNST
jgi:hypothetical protein